MSEQQDKESSDGAAKPSSTATGPTVTRFRSRFPKAMPNLAPRNPTATSTPSSATPTEEKAVEVAPIQETPSSDVSKTVETTSTDQASSITISTPESPKKQVSINAGMINNEMRLHNRGLIKISIIKIRHSNRELA